MSYHNCTAFACHATSIQVTYNIKLHTALQQNLIDTFQCTKSNISYSFTSEERFYCMHCRTLQNHNTTILNLYNYIG